MSANPFLYKPLPTGEETEEEMAQAKSPLATIFDFLQTIVIFLIILIVIYIFFIIPTEVSGKSMFPNFDDGQILLTNRLVAQIGGQGVFTNYNYQRGDVVVFIRDNGQTDLIKRVVGMPGDIVMVADSGVYINGVFLEEPYINRAERPTRAGSFMQDGVQRTVPAGSYFLMGDNRTNSLDSRDASVGFVKRERIRGAPFIRLFPTNVLSLIRRPSYDSL